MKPILSVKETKQLTALEKRLRQIDLERESLMTEARRLTGFEHLESATGIDQEFEDSKSDYDSKLVFVQFATYHRKRWLAEGEFKDNLRRVKENLKTLGMGPDEIDWDETEEEEEEP